MYADIPKVVYTRWLPKVSKRGGLIFDAPRVGELGIDAAPQTSRLRAFINREASTQSKDVPLINEANRIQFEADVSYDASDVADDIKRQHQLEAEAFQASMPEGPQKPSPQPQKRPAAQLITRTQSMTATSSASRFAANADRAAATQMPNPDYAPTRHLRAMERNNILDLSDIMLYSTEFFINTNNMTEETVTRDHLERRCGVPPDFVSNHYAMPVQTKRCLFAHHTWQRTVTDARDQLCQLRMHISEQLAPSLPRPGDKAYEGLRTKAQILRTTNHFHSFLGALLNSYAALARRFVIFHLHMATKEALTSGWVRRMLVDSNTMMYPSFLTNMFNTHLGDAAPTPNSPGYDRLLISHMEAFVNHLFLYIKSCIEASPTHLEISNLNKHAARDRCAMRDLAKGRLEREWGVVAIDVAQFYGRELRDCRTSIRDFNAPTKFYDTLVDIDLLKAEHYLWPLKGTALPAEYEEIIIRSKHKEGTWLGHLFDKKYVDPIQTHLVTGSFAETKEQSDVFLARFRQMAADDQKGAYERYQRMKEDAKRAMRGGQQGRKAAAAARLQKPVARFPSPPAKTLPPRPSPPAQAPPRPRQPAIRAYAHDIGFVLYQPEDKEQSPAKPISPPKPVSQFGRDAKSSSRYAAAQPGAAREFGQMPPPPPPREPPPNNDGDDDDDDSARQAMAMMQDDVPEITSAADLNADRKHKNDAATPNAPPPAQVPMSDEPAPTQENLELEEVPDDDVAPVSVIPDPAPAEKKATDAAVSAVDAFLQAAPNAPGGASAAPPNAAPPSPPHPSLASVMGHRSPAMRLSPIRSIAPRGPLRAQQPPPPKAPPSIPPPPQAKVRQVHSPTPADALDEAVPAVVPNEAQAVMEEPPVESDAADDSGLYDVEPVTDVPEGSGSPPPPPADAPLASSENLRFGESGVEMELTPPKPSEKAGSKRKGRRVRGKPKGSRYLDIQAGRASDSDEDSDEHDEGDGSASEGDCSFIASSEEEDQADAVDSGGGEGGEGEGRPPNKKKRRTDTVSAAAALRAREDRRADRRVLNKLKKRLRISAQVQEREAVRDAPVVPGDESEEIPATPPRRRLRRINDADENEAESSLSVPVEKEVKDDAAATPTAQTETSPSQAGNSPVPATP